MFVKTLLCIAACAGLLSASPFSLYSIASVAVAGQIPVAPDSGVSTSDKLLRLQQSQSEEEDLILEEPTVAAPAVKNDSVTAKLPPANMTPSFPTHRSVPEISSVNSSAVPAQQSEKVPAGTSPLPVSNASAADTTDEIAGSDTAHGLMLKSIQDSIIPLSVEKERSVNFAENLRDYKSPRQAVLLSLLVPGLGQAWIGNRILAASFITAEAAIIGLSVWQYSGANVKRKAAEEYVGDTSHYSVAKFNKYYSACINAFAKKFNTTPDAARILVNKTVLGAYDADTTHDFSDDLQRTFNDRNNNTQFYELIRNSGGDGIGNAYITGFTDVRPFNDDNAYTRFVDNWPAHGSTVFDSTSDTIYYWHPTGLSSNDTDSVYFKFDVIRKDGSSIFKNDPTVFGLSGYFAQFYKKDRAVEDQRKLAKNILFALVVNHVISAVDAGILAKAHNDRLLNKESFWQRIHVQGQFAVTSTGMTPQCTISLLF